MNEQINRFSEYALFVELGNQAAEDAAVLCSAATNAATLTRSSRRETTAPNTASGGSKAEVIEECERVRFIVPGDPVGKERARVTRYGSFTPKKTARWEDAAELYAALEMRGRELMAGPVRVTINAYFPIPASWPKWKREQAAHENVWHTTTPDEDNVGKAAKDAMNDVVYKDDAQICSSSVYKRYSADPRVEVAVMPLGGLHSKSLKDDLA